MNVNQNTVQTVIHPATHMGAVTLAVSDLTKSLDFYSNVLGITRIDPHDSDNAAAIGVGTTPLLHLHELRGAHPQPNYSTGLYHVAILVPSRPDLGRVLINLARTQYPVQGFGDHFVSEAIYLADPDGNGLEIYRDRPRSEWKYNGSQIVMGTEAVDVDGVIASVENPNDPFAGIAEGTVIGHVHLRVGNIAKAEAFYHGVLGFDVMAKMPSALFVSAGGYHHHLGMNVWQSRGAPCPPADSVGLREYLISVPDSDTLDQLASRLANAGVTYERHDSGLRVDDPWGNTIQVVPDTK